MSTWLSASKKGWLTGSLSRGYCRIQRTFGPHALRHTFAHNLKAAGVGDENLMALGRWRDAKSMFRYGKSTREVRAREALLKNSLADKFGK